MKRIVEKVYDSINCIRRKEKLEDIEMTNYLNRLITAKRVELWYKHFERTGERIPFSDVKISMKDLLGE